MYCSPVIIQYVVALIESCRKISGIKELKDMPLEISEVVLRGETLAGRELKSLKVEERKTNITSWELSIFNVGDSK